MTEQEAIKILQLNMPFVASKEANEAVDMAIKALEKQILDNAREIADKRCLTCDHYVGEEIVPPICYFCCKGLEDNYVEKKGE